MAAFGLCVAQATFLAAAFMIGAWLLDESGAKLADDFTGFWAAGQIALGRVLSSTTVAFKQCLPYELLATKRSW